MTENDSATAGAGAGAEAQTVDHQEPNADDPTAADSVVDESATVDTAIVDTAAVGTTAAGSDVAAVATTEDAEEDDPLVEEGEIAGDYLEQLLDVLDFDGDIDLDVESDRAVVSIDGSNDLKKLIGVDGEGLDALQELTRLAVQQVTGQRSRLMLDVGGWRADKRATLTALGVEVARRVTGGGGCEEMAPMTPFERKVVHDAVATVDGAISESAGVEPQRRVVVLLAADAQPN